MKLKHDFNENDLLFWFGQFEARISNYGVKSQWQKRQALADVLPQHVAEQVKDLLRLNKSSAGEVPYKTLKDNLLEIFGQKPEELFQKAISLMLETTPSALLKKLIDLVCAKSPRMTNCCCKQESIV